MKKLILIPFLCLLNGFLNAQTVQQLRDSATRFAPMPRESGQLFAFNGSATFSSGTPFNDIEFTIFDTDYMEGETHGFDVFMPVDPSDAFPGANKVKLVRCVGNVDLDFSYGGAKGDRIILGTSEIAVPFFLRGTDRIDNDYAVIQNFDYNNGYIQLKGQAIDYRLQYFKLADSVKTEGYYLFYTKNNVIDLVAFIFPCGDLGLAVSGNAARNPLALCANNDSTSTLNLTNPKHFRYAQPLSTAIATTNGVSQFGSNGKEVVGALTVDYQGNAYIGGLTDGNMDGKTDAPNEIFMSKINPNGTVAWTTELATAEGTLLIDATSDSSFLYVAGRTLGALPGFTNAGRWDGILLKLRLDNGQIVATNQWGNAGIDGYGNIILDDAGNLFISGQGSPAGPASTDDKYLFAKHKKSDLSNVWRVIEPPVTTGFVASAELWGGLSYIPSTTAGDGKVVIGGWYITNSGANGFLGVYDNLNATIATRKHSAVIASTGVRADWILDNAVDKDGNIYAVGFTTGNLASVPLGDGDGYIVKYSPTLTNPVFVQIGTPQADCLRKLDIDKVNGKLYALGYTYGNYTTPTYQGKNADNTLETGDILVQKFDLNLNKLEARQFGTPHEDRGLSYLKDSVLYVGGMTEGTMVSTNLGSFDGFLVALKTSDLSIQKPRITAISTTKTTNFTVFPNPTSGFLTIENPEINAVNYALYSITGQKIQTGIFTEGSHFLDLSALSNGVYLLSFTDSLGTKMVKVVKN
jgi:Secretion system C-terminal sorting domain